jgi:hypothetical protein
MKRALSCFVTVLLLVAALAAPAMAKNPANADQGRKGAPLQLLQKRWIAWAFGSSTNPLMTGTCGELIDGYFFLTAAGEPGSEVDCEVPAGVPLLATPGGSVSWQSEKAKNKDLLTERDEVLAELDNPMGTLDGESLGNFDALLSTTNTYMIKIEESSFIHTLEPDNPSVKGNHLRVASGGWWIVIPPLAPGEHELVLSDEQGGVTLDITFHITAV